MSDLLNPVSWQILDANGDPSPGATAEFYLSGTTFPKTVYADNDLSVPFGSVVTADSAGVMPQVFSSGGTLKVVVKDALGALIYTLDPAPRSAASGSAASDVSFSPTTELPYTNVQDAVEGAAAAAASGYSAFGLGVSGNAALIADIDATGTASGTYRYDGTTSWTFPASVTKSDGGICIVQRSSSGTARMIIAPSTGDVSHERRLQSGAWQSYFAHTTGVSSDISADTGSTAKVPTVDAVETYVASATIVTPGEIGALVFAYCNVNLNYGAETDGANLRPAAAPYSITFGSGGGTVQSGLGSALPTGTTWKCLGRSTVDTTLSGTATLKFATLFQRVS